MPTKSKQPETRNFSFCIIVHDYGGIVKNGVKKEGKHKSKAKQLCSLIHSARIPYSWGAQCMHNVRRFVRFNAGYRCCELRSAAKCTQIRIHSHLSRIAVQRAQLLSIIDFKCFVPFWCITFCYFHLNWEVKWKRCGVNYCIYNQ